MDDHSPEADRARALALGAATVYEASGQAGALPPEIKPVVAGMRVAGPALPVSGPPGDNLSVHRAIAAAREGDVLVIDVGGAFDHGYLGDVLVTAAVCRGVRGIVVNGCVRDRDGLERIGLPVFARGLAIAGTTKRPEGRGGVGVPVACGAAVVRPGDLVVADADGVVVVAADEVAHVVARAQDRADHEERVVERLRAGETTVEIYALPT